MDTTTANPHPPHPTSPALDPRSFLLYLSLGSIFILLVPLFQKIYRYLNAQYEAHTRSPVFLSDDAPPAEGEEPVLVAPPTAPPRFLAASGGSLWADFNSHIAASGGWVPFGLNVVRFVGCVALLAVSVAAAVLDSTVVNEGTPVMDVMKNHGGKSKHRKEKVRQAFGREEWVEIGQCCVFFYLSLLSLMSLTATKPLLLKQITRHLSVLLLLAFALYTYRNLLPLLVSKRPKDIALHGPHGKHAKAHWEKYSAAFVWTRLAVLGVVAVGAPAVEFGLKKWRDGRKVRLEEGDQV